MKKHIKVNQFALQELNVPSELITKLYNLIIRTENGEEVWDTMDAANITTSLCGSFKTKGYTYEEYINKINEYFGDTLTIVAEGFYILFKDSNVLNTLLSQTYNNVTLDGIGITKEQASNIIFASDLFKGNTSIEYFNEFKYFTSLNAKNTNISQPLKNTSFSFKGCTNLKQIDLSNLVVPVPLAAFRDCSSLESINNLSKCNTIGELAFYNCISLQSIDLTNVTTLGAQCFVNTSLGQTLTNDSLSNILYFCGNRDGGVFYKYANSWNGGGVSMLLNFETLNLPNCLSIGDCVFAKQTIIKNVIIENLTTLSGQRTFWACGNLKTAKLTGSYAKLTGDFDFGGDGIFQNCTSLTNVELSPYLTNLTVNMFNGCTSLTTVNFNDFQENLEHLDGMCLNNTSALTHKIFYLPRCITLGGIRDSNGVFTANNPGNNYGNLSFIVNDKSFYLPKITKLDIAYASNNSRGYSKTLTYLGTSSKYYMPYITMFSFSNQTGNVQNSTINTLYFKNLTTVYASTFAGMIINILIFNNVTPPQLQTISGWTDTGDGNNGINLFNQDMFHTTKITDGIYVPDSAVETYKQTAYFASVRDLIKPLSSCHRITIEQGMNGESGLIEEYMNEK